MQAYLDSLVDDGAAGVLLHYRSGDQTWVGSSGRSQLDPDRPVDPDGWFRVGSVTKTFTAVLVLQLVAEGKLRLDDPVGEWVPGVPDSISLRQLLNHTSGLYNYTDDLPADRHLRDRYLHRDPAEALRTGLAKARLFEPGGSWSYSNTNYIVLGLLVEAVTGKAYADEVRTRVLERLGLERTLLPGDDVDLPEPHARGYLQIAGEWVDLARFNASQAWAAGEIVSTAADLNRFYAAVLGGKLLGEPEQEAMLTVVPVDDSFGYALGIERRRLPDGQVVWGHTGGIFGYQTISYHAADLSRQLTLSYTGTTLVVPETGQVLAGLLS
ncbi:D-alanyl-D-alanine carboxypeptidase [Kribbella rubisoli]|uniref:D-alanyl-D-alanine carboxypeptidase n=1 Tax=Kribbella rubisoli TaxID=3075929 RepID=A0A4Q7WQI5_9ACTN|nr:serine hydrolase domain-containing protein [Kribbella rubisoli]RZU12158.1 D-alanyl-D-alanine carboxypeptidase [Kribbella rubisoli]